MQQYELNLRDYLRIVKKRKHIVILTTIAVTLFTAFLNIKNRPAPIYQSTSSVKIEENKTFEGMYMEMMAWESGDSLETQTLVIESFPIMEMVAKELSLLDKNLPSNEIRADRQYLDIVLGLKDSISAEREGDTSIINITATSSDALMAQQIANATAKIYREDNIEQKNKRVLEAKKFIESQLKFIGNKLKTAEEKMQRFMEETSLVSIDSHIKRSFKKLVYAQDEYELYLKKVTELSEIIDYVKDKNSIPSTSFKNLSIDDFSKTFINESNRIAELNLKKDGLLYELTDLHPQVKQVSEETNNIIKKILNELFLMEKNYKKRLDSINEDIKGLQKKYISMPKNELTIARLRRNVNVNEELYSELEKKYQEVLIKESEKFEGVTIVRPALLSDFPINSKKLLNNIYIGAILGFVIGLVLTFLYETMDTSIASIDEVEELLGIPVIGLIPFVRNEEIKENVEKIYSHNVSNEDINRNANLVFHFTPMSPFTESYKTLRTNLQFMNIKKNIKVMLFTSSSSGEGKTTCSINIAISLAQSGKKVLLVDADLRKSAIHKTFGLDREPGLSDVLLGSYNWKDVVKDTMDVIVGKIEIESIMFVPGIDNLHILTSGDMSMNPVELLMSKNMEEFIKEVKEVYDFVLFDCSPTLLATDAIVLGSKVDGVFLVYKTGEVARAALNRSKVQLESVGAKVCAVILNGTKADLSPDLYATNTGSYIYGYGETVHVNKGGTFGFIKDFFAFFKMKKTGKLFTLRKVVILVLSIMFLSIGFFYAK